MMTIVDVRQAVHDNLGTDCVRECATAQETKGDDTTVHVDRRDARGIVVLPCCSQHIGKFYSKALLHWASKHNMDRKIMC